MTVYDIRGAEVFKKELKGIDATTFKNLATEPYITKITTTDGINYFNKIMFKEGQITGVGVTSQKLQPNKHKTLTKQNQHSKRQWDQQH